MRTVKGLSMHPLNFPHGGYQRAEASSIPEYDDRFCNENSNASKGGGGEQCNGNN